MKDTLKALQSKFEYKLKELKDDLEGKITAMRLYNREQFKAADERLTRLEEAITKEVEDRITESDELIFETRDEIQMLQSRFDGEVQTRIDREKDILQKLDNEKYGLGKKIDNERTDKSLTLGKFRDDTNRQLKMQHKYVEEFQKNAMIEFQKMREEHDRLHPPESVADRIARLQSAARGRFHRFQSRVIGMARRRKVKPMTVSDAIDSLHTTGT